MGDTTGMLTATLLNQQCIKASILRPTSDCDLFMERLKEYVAQHGHKLNTSSTANTFFLAKKDIKDRLAFCKENLPMVEHSLHSLLFVDETTIEESAHPKGQHGCMIT